MMTVTESDDGWHWRAARSSALFLTVGAPLRSLLSTFADDDDLPTARRTARSYVSDENGGPLSQVYAAACVGSCRFPKEQVTGASRRRSPNRERNQCLCVYETILFLVKIGGAQTV